MSSASPSALSIALRNGGTCVLSGGTLTIGETAIPLQTIASASLVADMSVPVAPGMPPAPAVELRLSDGSTTFLTPVEQGDAIRLLQAIQAARPNLPGAAPAPGAGYAQPLPSYPQTQPGYAPPQPTYAPPQPGYAPPQPGYAPSGAPFYPGYPGYAPQVGAADGDRGLAVLAHLSGFILPVILPLILWLTLRQSHPYSSKQAKQAFFFQLCLWTVGLAVVGVSYGIFLATFFSMISSFSIPTDPGATPTVPPFPVGAFIALIVMEGAAILWSVTHLVGAVIASMQVAQGKPFHYPLFGRL